MSLELTTAIAALVNLLSQRLRQFQQGLEEQQGQKAEIQEEIYQVTKAYYEVLNRAASIMHNPEMLKRIDSNDAKAFEQWLEEIKAAKEFKPDELQRIGQIDRRLQEMVATP
jgi:DNA-binding protein H-NS